METQRLIIRRYIDSDWEDLYEYLSDAEVVKYEPYDVFSKEQAKQEAINRSSQECFYAICIKDSNKLIGNLYFQKGDFDTWELGYVFNSKYQGKGYATEAAKALVAKAFDEWGARRVIAMCNPLNTKSWKLLERLGMRREGTLIKNIYFKYDSLGNPIWADTYEYGLLKEEWISIN
jgi:RimJ/RimL family protein N-acetyltransferase